MRLFNDFTLIKEVALYTMIDMEEPRCNRGLSEMIRLVSIAYLMLYADITTLICLCDFKVDCMQVTMPD